MKWVGGPDLSPGLWVADFWFEGSFLEMVKGISKICERGEVGYRMQHLYLHMFPSLKELFNQQGLLVEPSGNDCIG